MRVISHVVTLLGFVFLAPITAMTVSAQSTQSRQLTVAILEDYPAFQSSVRQRDPRAKQPRAIVIRQDPGSQGGSVILLNPDHADVQTLAEAMEALQRCSASGTAPANFVPIVARARPQEAPRDAARLAAWLNELKAQPVAEHRALGGSGRTIQVDVPQACTGSAGR